MLKKLENKKAIALIVTVIIALGIIMTIFPGANLDTDYTGGTMVIINLGGDYDYKVIEKAFAGLDRSEVLVTTDDKAIVTVNSALSDEKVTSIVNEIKTTYKNASLESSGAVTRAKNPYKLAYVGLPVLALALLMFLYIWRVFNLKSAVAGGLAIVLTAVMTAALSIIVRVEISPLFTSAILVTAVLAAAEAILFARILNGIVKKKDTDDIVEKALLWAPVKLWSGLWVVGIIAVCVIILATPPLKMFALSMLLGVLSVAFAVRYIIPAIIRSVKK